MRMLSALVIGHSLLAVGHSIRFSSFHGKFDSTARTPARGVPSGPRPGGRGYIQRETNHGHGGERVVLYPRGMEREDGKTGQ